MEWFTFVPMAGRLGPEDPKRQNTAKGVYAASARGRMGKAIRYGQVDPGSSQISASVAI